jgi:hypothetical protein
MNEATKVRARRDADERRTDEPPLQTLDPLPPDPTSTSASSSGTHKTRVALVVGLVIAALIVGSSGMRWFDQASRPTTPTWFAACREAVDVSAQLHRLQGAQLERAMELTFGAVAGIPPRDDTSDQSAIARLQRNADEATRRCTAG